MENKLKSINKTIDESTKNLVALLMNDVTLHKANNSFLTEDSVRLQLTDFLGATRIREKMKHGYDLMMNDLPAYLTKIQLDLVNQELENAVDIITSMMQEKGQTEEMGHKLEELPDHLQGILQISDSTFNHFYDAGYRYYNAKRYHEAANVFFLLSFLNPYQFNVLLALGLAEANQHQWQKALQAFASAGLLDLKSVYPHLYSAQCYQQMGDEANMENALEGVFYILEKHPHPEGEKIKSFIQKLSQKKR